MLNQWLKGCGVDPPLDVRRGRLVPEMDKACTSGSGPGCGSDMGCGRNCGTKEGCRIVNVSVGGKGPSRGVNVVGDRESGRCRKFWEEEAGEGRGGERERGRGSSGH